MKRKKQGKRKRSSSLGPQRVHRRRDQHAMPARPREEVEILRDLAQLCQSPGYAHAIAFFCHRDNFISFDDVVTTEATEHLFSSDRLIRPEISTLIGLMVKGAIDFANPTPQAMTEYIEKTEALLAEIHEAMAMAWVENFANAQVEQTAAGVLGAGSALREPIFYGGESAYSHQYRDFSTPKYQSDNDWIVAHYGFKIEDAVAVASALRSFQPEKQTTTMAKLRASPPSEWSFLPGLVVSAQELSEYASLDQEIVEAVFRAFALGENQNDAFNALNDINAANAAPLVSHPDGYVLFQQYSLLEAIYESPFYWMIADKAYSATSLRNRGKFAENLCRRMLDKVFGQHVYANVDIILKKGEKVSEIDALVLFGSYAIILQVKSKRLTALARKGNDQQIKDDFKRAVQDASNQATVCAEALLDNQYRFVDASGAAIQIPKHIERIFPICVVSDHYPALSFQARQFLNYRTDKILAPPIATDIFALDAMTEMLSSPLRFLHYLDLRSRFGEKINMMHELTMLGFHLSGNLWVDDKYDLIMLGDDIAADLDIAMMVRRDAIPGAATPKGVLTRFDGTPIGTFIDQIERAPDERVVGLGLLLLSLSGDAAGDISEGVRRLAQRAQADGRLHDLSVGLSTVSSGLTIYCARNPAPDLPERLRAHCLTKKYAQRADSWFGIVIDPRSSEMVTTVHIDFPWEQDDQLDALALEFPQAPAFNSLAEADAASASKRSDLSRQQRRAQDRLARKSKRTPPP